ncbi:MAG TPA: glycosyltransferase family 4 protein [Acidimicrobiales bacterium]|nr:glycosyltransferase family 4 protein [Acidimicrobiales bacterium]
MAVAASDLPHPEGTAAGRDLWAWCEAALALGHELEAWIWNRSPSSPAGPVPPWASYRPVPPASSSRWGTFVTPAQAASWHPDPEAVVVADHLPSAGAVAGRRRAVVTLHYRALADARSVRQVRPWHLRTAFEEQRAVRRAELVLAYSERVGRHLTRPAHVVPMTCPLPAQAVDPVEEPVAALIADWWWRPNRLALDHLLALWPDVRAVVPTARLLLAGRHFPADAVGHVPGVEVLGPVPSSVDLLERAAVVAFPCPTSSGPKGKTLEAMAYGVPVLTTPAGMEGIVLGPEGDAMVVRRSAFAARLASLLQDPEARARLGRIGRQAVADHHSPRAAAQARVAAFSSAFGL